MTIDLEQMLGEMARMSVVRREVEPVTEVLMLASLGSVILGSIAATKQLGHTRLVHTNTYRHSTHPTAELVKCILDGRIGPVDDALDRWWAELPDLITPSAPTERTA